MSSFCVFGVTKSGCLAKAKKEVGLLVGAGSEKRLLSEAEWMALVEEKASAALSTQKARQCSPTFDAPQFAKAWMDHALKCGELRDDAYIAAMTETGDFHPKTKQPLKAWKYYEYRL